MQPREIFLQHLPLIERIIRTVCRGSMNATQMEEFSGFVRLRLIENDYAMVRGFQGRTAFGTYLTAVIARLLNDYRNHERGKWHDSAEAKRLGALAVDLERLMVRDSRSVDDALVLLLPRYPDITKETLERLAERFPRRYRRKMVGLEEMPESSVDEGAAEKVANAETASVISRVISEYISQVPLEDQLLFQLRFEQDMPVPQIAQVLHQDAQALYRRLRTHVNGLRKKLEAAGVNAADVTRLMASDSAVLDLQLKNGGRPSGDAEDSGGWNRR